MQRRGDDKDERNDLVFEFARLVAECKPTMFLMENVPALAGNRGKRHLSRLQRRFARAGYHVTHAILDAADYGVPQHRRRLFIVGELGAQHFSFPKATHTPDTYVTTRDAIADLPPPSRNGVLPNHEPDNVSELNRLRISFVPTGGGRADIPSHLRLPCHRVSVEKAGHRGVYGRLDWDKPANTITTKCNSFTRGRFAHPSENRNISMREAARLQGFPDDFVFLGDKVSVAHQVGNAVPPPLAKAIGQALARALKRHGEPARESNGQLSIAF